MKWGFNVVLILAFIAPMYTWKHQDHISVAERDHTEAGDGVDVPAAAPFLNRES